MTNVFRVFVSSTFLDLRAEREAVRETVLRMREAQFAGMEYFGSRDETTREASLVEVDASRVYVGIFGARYGSGITEKEYRRARENGLPCFIYFKDAAAIADDGRETDPAGIEKLDALKKELKREHLVSTFGTADDLSARVTADLHDWLFKKYLTPKLQGALRNEVAREEAQALLSAVKDLSELNRDLVARLQGAGFNINVGGNFIGRDNITYNFNAPAGAVSAPVIPTLHQLRAAVGDFVGREKEIADLSSALRGGASAGISGISGMGGIGKTELALYVAGRLRDVYPDAQLVVDMRGTDERPRDPADALASCIRAFVGLEQRLPDDLQELTRIYLSVLEGKRALILLDNAFDGAQVRPFLPPAGSALLVTSRNVVTLPRMRRVTLEQLSPAEARELLQGIAGRVNDKTADQISYLCGYLPLAIRAAGSLLDVTADLAPEAYAEQLRDERRRLERIGTEGVDLDVEASLGLSYARLAPDAARVFRQLSVFPATFDARAEEFVCEDRDHKHLTDLLRRNLVRYNDETQRYSLHDLARLFADSRMSDDEGHANHLRHSAYYLAVLDRCGDLYLEGGDAIKSGLAHFDVERRNIEAGQEWACQHSSGDEAAARLCNEYPSAGVYLLYLRQHLRQIISWLEAALAAARQLRSRVAEGGHLVNLGLSYQILGELRRAIEFHEQALLASRETSDRSSEGNALGNLGSTYRLLGEPRRAVESYEQQLVIAREIADRRGEGNALGGLGNAYADLGEVSRAVDYHKQYLAIAREIGDRLGEGTALANLGVAYQILKETHLAIEFYKQALVVFREIGDRLNEGEVVFYIGLALGELGDREKAIASVEAALEISEQIESPTAEKAREQLAEWRGEA